MQAAIITPTLDAADWIGRCVANVAQQGEVIREHIVVDGGSRDGTARIVAELARTHRHLRLVTRPGCNQSAAMNIGVAAASADIVGILNADDHYQPDAVRRGVRRLGDGDAPAFVTGDCLLFDPEGHFVWNRPADLRLESLLLGWETTQFPCNSSAYFYRRAVHDVVGSYDVADDFTMDLDFILRCAARVGMRHVPEHWGNFLLRPGAKTFEDAAGPQRRAAIIARHVERLDAGQRAAMARIAAEKRSFFRFRQHYDAPARASPGLAPPMRVSGLLPHAER